MSETASNEIKTWEITASVIVRETRTLQAATKEEAERAFIATPPEGRLRVLTDSMVTRERK